MHELSVVKAMIKKVEEYQKQESETAVRRFTVEVGSLTCVDPQRLQFCFELAKSDTELREAELVIRNIEAEARCNKCHSVFSVKILGEPCACGSYDLALSSGKELDLVEIEFE